MKRSDLKYLYVGDLVYLKPELQKVFKVIKIYNNGNNVFVRDIDTDKTYIVGLGDIELDEEIIEDRKNDYKLEKFGKRVNMNRMVESMNKGLRRKLNESRNLNISFSDWEARTLRAFLTLALDSCKITMSPEEQEFIENFKHRLYGARV